MWTKDSDPGDPEKSDPAWSGSTTVVIIMCTSAYNIDHVVYTNLTLFTSSEKNLNTHFMLIMCTLNFYFLRCFYFYFSWFLRKQRFPRQQQKTENTDQINKKLSNTNISGIQVWEWRLRTCASCTVHPVFESSLGGTSSSQILLYCDKGEWMYYLSGRVTSPTVNTNCGHSLTS